MYNKLENKVILHSKGVAEVMYKLANENKEEMYLLGLLHDIGKLRGFEDHEKNGAILLTHIGIKYPNEIYYHGKIQDEYSSPELDLLNAADLSVDSEGNIVGYQKRIEDIGNRYGFESTEYKNAITLSKTLLELLNKVKIHCNYEGGHNE
jgi:putative nucleotidyltransferase with HDIG domain